MAPDSLREHPDCEAAAALRTAKGHLKDLRRALRDHPKRVLKTHPCIMGLQECIPLLTTILQDPDHADSALRILTEIADLHPIAATWEIAAEARDGLRRNLGEMLECTTRETQFRRSEDVHHAIELLLGTDAECPMAREAMRRFWPTIRHAMENGATRSQRLIHAEGMGTAYAVGGEELGVEIVDWLELWKRTLRPSESAEVVRGAVRRNGRGEALIQTLLMPSDIHTHLLETWKANAEQANHAWYAAQNLRRMLRIAKKNRAAVAETLHREFGIVNFARYPEKLLRRQYRQRDDDTTPYGLLLAAKMDHNSSFCPEENSGYALCEQIGHEIDRMFRKTGRRFRLRIIEAGTRAELEHLLASMCQRYGPGSIRFGVFAGHGNASELALSEKNDLTAGVFKNRSMREAFAKGVHIAFDACNAGCPGGIAQKISRNLRCTTHATARCVNLESLRIRPSRRGEDPPSLEARYERGATITYAQGKRVRKTV